MTYKVTDEFLKTFGINSLNDLPKLPKYKLDSNRQIVIDELENDQEKDNDKNIKDLKELTEVFVPQEGEEENK